MRLLGKLVFFMCMPLLFVGCATTNLLPRSEDVATGTAGWKDFSDAEHFYKNVNPGTTRISDLPKMGLDLEVAKNIRTLAVPTLVKVFSEASFSRFDRLPPPVQRCLHYEENCVGYVVAKSETHEDGTGSVALRLLRFKEESVVRGWNVEMFFLVHNGVIVYKHIEGTPNGTERHKKTVRPLGPLLDMNIPNGR